MLEKIEEIAGHLGAALMQVAPSDDKIIVGHIADANVIAISLLRDLINADRGQ